MSYRKAVGFQAQFSKGLQAQCCVREAFGQSARSLPMLASLEPRSGCNLYKKADHSRQDLPPAAHGRMVIKLILLCGSKVGRSTAPGKSCTAFIAALSMLSESSAAVCTRRKLPSPPHKLSRCCVRRISEAPRLAPPSASHK